MANGGRSKEAAEMGTSGADGSPFPTTFVQADATSFKQVVQMLTGAAEPAGKPVAPVACRTGPKRSAFKLADRRHNSFKNLRINPLMAADFSGKKPPSDKLSPSVLDFPSLKLSPVTPLIPDPFCRGDSPGDRHAAERGFYLLPSPREGEPPRLLPLFPGSSSSSP
ncbi:VQ motif-containing protein 4-like [Wolffia australiana]